MIDVGVAVAVGDAIREVGGEVTVVCAEVVGLVCFGVFAGFFVGDAIRKVGGGVTVVCAEVVGFVCFGVFAGGAEVLGFFVGAAGRSSRSSHFTRLMVLEYS